jgi:hypothetical protein
MTATPALRPWFAAEPSEPGVDALAASLSSPRTAG